MKYTIYLFLVISTIPFKSWKVVKKNNDKMGNSYFKEIKATHFISTKFMSLEEDLMISLNTKGLILELVSYTEEPSIVQQKLNEKKPSNDSI